MVKIETIKQTKSILKHIAVTLRLFKSLRYVFSLYFFVCCSVCRLTEPSARSLSGTRVKRHHCRAARSDHDRERTISVCVCVHVCVYKKRVLSNQRKYTTTYEDVWLFQAQ